MIRLSQTKFSSDGGGIGAPGVDDEEDQEGVYLVAAAVAVVVVVVGEVILVVVGDADAVVLVDLLQVLLLLLLGDLAARGAALQRPNEDYCNQLYYSCPLLP
eukprot:CAMPEP_0203646456 /NCGR_PEP_ID=MMETSP0088-20131115/13079_1 /ASSEMBLY_ACC=CAM_ASM_001087 /TAXON_ID=426623 /ORGANISM="Chaetoceros affinis, Strain CCMP159" /LENGTH=101 /DNA_ID=CAMNT_0050503683 /DNA_START=129 /DNA_END=431 /DNA_ORIENTATION=-